MGPREPEGGEAGGGGGEEGGRVPVHIGVGARGVWAGEGAKRCEGSLSAPWCARGREDGRRGGNEG